ALVGCGRTALFDFSDVEGRPDAAVDAGVDGGVDGGLDAGLDGGLDGGLDAGLDGGVDGGLDGGLDGGVDGGLDAGTPDCVQHSACSDGLVCNGAQRCVMGARVAVMPLACDDGEACTIDSCSEALGGCVSTLRDDDGDGFPSLACGGLDC